MGKEMVVKERCTEVENGAATRLDGNSIDTHNPLFTGIKSHYKVLPSTMLLMARLGTCRTFLLPAGAGCTYLSEMEILM